MTELRSTRRLVLYAAAAAAGAAALVTALLVNIGERKQEARNPFFRVVELTDETEDPATWERTSRSNTMGTGEPSIRSGPATAGASRARERRLRSIPARLWRSRGWARTLG
jgi:hypothetical protein